VVAEPRQVVGMIEIKSESQLEQMRAAGRVVGKILDAFEEAAQPGVSTLELDALAERIIVQEGARPAFKGYRGFPATICASINAEVVHGIPSNRKLENGDIASLDVGAVVEGYFSDAAVTLPIGVVSPELRHLIEVTRQALEHGIAQFQPGGRLSDISHAVQSEVEQNGFSVVRDFVGHGIGSALHEPPEVPNYGKPGLGPVLEVGMVLAIEPMVNQGEPAVEVLDDGWTAVTQDGKPSAHFEHTVALTQKGPEILTECLKKKLSK
jgi:methionyl aminopeptidase